MAEQSGKIEGIKRELETIKSRLRDPNLEPRVKTIYYNRGKALEKIISDNELVKSPKNIPGQAPNEWGTDQPEEDEPEEDEDGEESDDEEDENDEQDSSNPESKEDQNKNELAKEEVKNLENSSFDENTKEGQEAKAKAEAAKIAGGQAADPNTAATAAPKAAPDAKSEVPGSEVPGGAAIGNKAAPTEMSQAAAPAASGKSGKPTAGSPAEKQNISDRIRSASANFQNNAKASIKKATANLKQKVSKDALKALVKSPIFWEIVGWTLLVILVIGIAYALFASFWRTGDSGNNGNTYVQPVDPVKDKDWLAKLLSYSGDSEITAISSKATIDATKKALTDIQSDVSLTAGLRGKATTALNDLSIYENSAAAQKKAAGEKVIADIKSITDEFYACRVIYTKGTSPYFYVTSVDGPSLRETDKLGTNFGMPAFALNPRLCGMLIAMSDPNTGVKIDTTKYPMMKVTFRGSHSIKVSLADSGGKNTVSSHYCGQGVDLSPGNNTGLTQKQFGDKIRDWLWANEKTLKAANIFPEETFGPGPDYTGNINNFGRYTKVSDGEAAKFGVGYMPGHEDHTHIGFGTCIIK